jgi:hypothetical protein
MDQLSASSTNNLIFVPSKDLCWDSFMSSVTDKPSTMRNTWNRKYRIKGEMHLCSRSTISLHLSSSSDTIIGAKGVAWGRGLMGQPHLERLKKIGRLAES